MKHKVLKTLYLNKGGFVSGESIAKFSGISRAAVKKHIDSLIEKGYDIVPQKKSGYMLKGINDILDEYSLRLFFDLYGINCGIYFYENTGSTNDQAKKLYLKSLEGVVVSAEQTGGKGRKGRTFVSDKGGVYVSYYCTPQGLSPFDAVKAVISAAAAAHRTIEKTGAKCAIKWANDIFCGDKKVCGILCEMVSEGENAVFLVQGIGINVNNGFSGDLSGIAASLKTVTGKAFDRAEICAMLIKELINCNNGLQSGGYDSLLQYYKNNCLTLGKNVTVSGDKEYKGVAKDIDQNGFLIVDTENGLTTVTYGDVSVLPDTV